MVRVEWSSEVLTHSEHEVVEGLLVDGLQGAHQLEGKVHEQRQVAPALLDVLLTLTGTTDQ